jgi:hypothetical protein
VIRTFTLKRARALADQALGQEDERQVRGLLNDALEGAAIQKHWPRVDDRASPDAEAFAG